MSDPRLDNLLITIIGGTLVVLLALPWTGGALAFLKPDAEGYALNLLLWYLVVGGLCGLAILFVRYLRLIEGASGEARSLERIAYLEFRRRLEAGGTAGRIYAEQLTRLLAAVDRFFGDAGKAAAAGWRKPFRLQAAVPLWSVPAFDRCLFLALLYPTVVAFLIWSITGESGLLSGALRLDHSASPNTRLVGLLSVLTFSVAAWHLIRWRRSRLTMVMRLSGFSTKS